LQSFAVDLAGAPMPAERARWAGKSRLSWPGQPMRDFGRSDWLPGDTSGHPPRPLRNAKLYPEFAYLVNAAFLAAFERVRARSRLL